MLCIIAEFYLLPLRLTSLGVYIVIIAGWSSNSNYALLGGLRSVAQTISYEVRIALIFISSILLIICFDIYFFYLYQEIV